jgi:hypothetical protein
MAVEDAEAPGRQHEEPRAGKQDPHQPDGDFALLPREPRRDDGDEPWREEDPDQHQHRGRQSEKRGDRRGDPPGLGFVARGPEPGVYRMNEAERTPSPKRFCRKLGMRKAALNASAASEVPK